MTEPASISANIAGRYALAVFELTGEAGGLAVLEQDLAALGGALDESADLRALIGSPLYSREDQARAITAVAAKIGLSPVFSNTLALLAAKRRLYVPPQLISRLAAMVSEAKGEVTAEVTAAAPLTKPQSEKLTSVLAKISGKTVKLNTIIDETVIGGLVVKLGSKMIDTSIRSKLASLQNAMKEVG